MCVPAWGTELRSTLNMQADLMNSQQQVLATRSGIGISSFTYTVPTTGTFYLSIRGIGAASATTTPGYSSYGSIGQYQALLSYPAVVSKWCQCWDGWCFRVCVEGVWSGAVTLGVTAGLHCCCCCCCCKDTVCADVSTRLNTNSSSSSSMSSDRTQAPPPLHCATDVQQGRTLLAPALPMLRCA